MSSLEAQLSIAQNTQQPWIFFTPWGLPVLEFAGMAGLHVVVTSCGSSLCGSKEPTSL